MKEFIKLSDLKELARPILEREERQRKENNDRFLRALAPKDYPPKVKGE